jgi:hypothetical protein
MLLRALRSLRGGTRWLHYRETFLHILGCSLLGRLKEIYYREAENSMPSNNYSSISWKYDVKKQTLPNNFATKEYRFNTMMAEKGLQHVPVKASAPFTLSKLTN